MPERHVFKSPDELSMDEAALIEPASIAFDAFRGTNLTANDTVVVFGTGAIGMISVWLAKYYGAGKVILVGRNNDKLEVSKKIGADAVINNREVDAVQAIKDMTNGNGAELIVETSGSLACLKDCIKATRRFGRISVVSFYEREADGLPIDPLVHGCLSLVGAAGRAGNAPGVCEIMCKNPIKLTPIISHHLPFSECLDAFVNEEKYHNSKIKVMIDFE